jgi:mannose/fructose/N-acetylgalactosamine-specific phosphotransferase system component IIC
LIAWSGWRGPVAGAALVALLELDGVQVGQFMLSRPIVLGALLGLVFGAPQTGLMVGICCELLSLDDLPVGDRLPLNATVAAAAAFLLTCGPAPLPPQAALPLGLGAGWAHQGLEMALRRRRQAFCGLAESSLRAGTSPRLGLLMTKALAEQAAGTFAVLAAFLLLAGPLVHALWPHVPLTLDTGLLFAWRLAPWLGLGVALQALRVRP